MFALLTGVLAGAAHVWAGPDHLAAVAPLAARHPGHAWMAGVRWGVGHSIGVAVVGLLALWLRETLPLEAISSHSERLVGVMLVGIGVWAIRRATRTTVHVHEHEHDGSRHVHLHAHRGATRPLDHETRRAHQHTHAPVGIGVLHGLAGSSHFLGVLPMLAFPTAVEAGLYLLAFMGGTVASMALFSGLIGLASRRCARHGVRFYRGFISACGAAAVVVGCAWLVLSTHGG